MAVLRGSSIVRIIHLLNISGIIRCVSRSSFCEKHIAWSLNLGVDFSEGESGRSWTALPGTSSDCEAHKTETVLWRSFCKSMHEAHAFQVTFWIYHYMRAVKFIKRYLTTSRGMSISSCPWKVEPSLAYSGVGGTSSATSCLLAGRYRLLAGRYPLLYTTPLA